MEILQLEATEDIFINGISLKDLGFVPISMGTGFLPGIQVRGTASGELYKIKDSIYSIEKHSQRETAELHLTLTASDYRLDRTMMQELVRIIGDDYSRIDIVFLEEAPLHFYARLVSEVRPAYFGGSENGIIELVFKATTSGPLEIRDSRQISLGTPVTLKSSSRTSYPKIIFQYLGADVDPIDVNGEYKFELVWHINYSSRETRKLHELYSIEVELVGLYEEHTYFTHLDLIEMNKRNRREQTASSDIKFSRLYIEQVSGGYGDPRVPPGSDVILTIKPKSGNIDPDNWRIRVEVEDLAV